MNFEVYDTNTRILTPKGEKGVIKYINIKKSFFFELLLNETEPSSKVKIAP